MRIRVFVLSILAAFTASCGEAVQPLASPSNLVGAVKDHSLTSLLIAPVQRSTPLPSDVTWSFQVGSGGATSSNSDVGLTVTVPAGAVSENVQITVTALAGQPVAYRFEPHGLQFGRNVYLTQDLNHTTLGLLSGLLLRGAYFATDSLELSTDGLAIVTEIIGAATNPLTRTTTFPIQHFSGYILASGRDSTEQQ